MFLDNRKTLVSVSLALIAFAAVIFLLAYFGALQGLYNNSCKVITERPPRRATEAYIPFVPGATWVYVRPCQTTVVTKGSVIKGGGFNFGVFVLLRQDQVQVLVTLLSDDKPPEVRDLARALFKDSEHSRGNPSLLLAEITSGQVLFEAADVSPGSLDEILFARLVDRSWAEGFKVIPRKGPAFPEWRDYGISLFRVVNGPDSKTMKICKLSRHTLNRLNQGLSEQKDRFVNSASEFLAKSKNKQAVIETSKISPSSHLILGNSEFTVSGFARRDKYLWSLYSRGIGPVATIAHRAYVIDLRSLRGAFPETSISDMVVYHRLIYYFIPGRDGIEWHNNNWLQAGPKGKLKFCRQSDWW